MGLIGKGTVKGGEEVRTPFGDAEFEVPERKEEAVLSREPDASVAAERRALG